MSTGIENLNAQLGLLSDEQLETVSDVARARTIVNVTLPFIINHFGEEAHRRRTRRLSLSMASRRTTTWRNACTEDSTRVSAAISYASSICFTMWSVITAPSIVSGPSARHQRMCGLESRRSLRRIRKKALSPLNRLRTLRPRSMPRWSPCSRMPLRRRKSNGGRDIAQSIPECPDLRPGRRACLRSARGGSDGVLATSGGAGQGDALVARPTPRGGSTHGRVREHGPALSAG